MAKRPCFSDHSTTVSNRDYNRVNIDALLESLFAVSDSGLIDASFNGLVKSRSTFSDQNDFIQCAIDILSVLLEAGKRCDRNLAPLHNASVWPLPPELTIRVFSLLDTRSACTAAATCSLFQKCAIHPLCYTNIDLASLPPKINASKFNNALVSTMIKRAGKSLESIKLGSLSILDSDEGRLRKMLPILTSSCLRSLSENGGAVGSRLRRLHLDSIEWEDERDLSAALSVSLSVCPSLVEIKIVNMHVSISGTLECVSRYCRLLERFTFEWPGSVPETVEASVCKEFVLNCPKITALTLQACQLLDSAAFELVKGFHKLKYVDISDCSKLTGAFLKNLGTKGGANSLEVMILRSCWQLSKVEVENFMTALLLGNFRLLKHLDISKSGGLVTLVDDDDDDDYDEAPYAMSFFDIPIKKLLEQRPNFCLVVEDI